MTEAKVEIDPNQTNLGHLKRTITILSDDEDEQIESNQKRLCSSNSKKSKPLSMLNQPMIRPTRQTSLSIVRTHSTADGQHEKKWNLEKVTIDSSENLSKQSKKKSTQTKATIANKNRTSNSITRAFSLPLMQTKIDDENSDESLPSNSDQIVKTNDNKIDSKSIWKQIFFKPKSTDDELKEQWTQLDKDPAQHNHQRFNRTLSSNFQRTCPFYKKIPGTSFCVDAFNYGVIEGIQAYFLSHFHSDHYGGLNKKFSNILYSNQITCNLCESQLGVGKDSMTVLPMNVFTNVLGIDVALLDANHCPGSNMFLFRFANGKLVLHTGDFRAAPQLLDNPLLRPNQIDTIYLDTTYCDAQYRFPPQEEVIESAVKLVQQLLSEQPKTLITVGTYLIGKERIFHAIAIALGCKIFVEPRKYKILNLLENADLSKRLTRNPAETNLHVVGMGSMTPAMLETYVDKNGLNYHKVIGIKPTGWTTPRSTAGTKLYSVEANSSNIQIYGFPYSEHSSFDELKSFIQYLKPKKIIPTVNVGQPSVREKMNGYFKQWLSI